MKCVVCLKDESGVRAGNQPVTDVNCSKVLWDMCWNCVMGSVYMSYFVGRK